MDIQSKGQIAHLLGGNSTSDPDAIEISFLIPCLNEAQTIHQCVLDCLEAGQASGTAFEVVVADNGSTDGSQEIAAKLGASVVHIDDRGYGNALMGGIENARGHFVIMADADLSYDFKEMPRFLGELRRGNDLVLGCRFPSGGGTIVPGAMPFLHRWLGNPVLSGLGRLFFNTNVRDFHCGIRAFDREKLLELELQTTGMEFASEMIVKAAMNRWKISEVPATLRRDARGRPPHLRTWHDGWRHLRFLLLHAPNWAFIYPGLFTTLAASLLFIRLLFGPILLGHVEFDTNTLLVAGVAVCLGMQVTALGLFCKVFGAQERLMPQNRLSLFAQKMPFEKGIVMGAVFGSLGIGCLTVATWKWKALGFGRLSYPDTLRWIALGTTTLVCGVQWVCSGFVLATLGLQRGRNKARNCPSQSIIPGKIAP